MGDDRHVCFEALSVLESDDHGLGSRGDMAHRMSEAGSDVSVVSVEQGGCHDRAEFATQGHRRAGHEGHVGSGFREQRRCLGSDQAGAEDDGAPTVRRQQGADPLGVLNRMKVRQALDGAGAIPAGLGRVPPGSAPRGEKHGRRPHPIPRPESHRSVSLDRGHLLAHQFGARRRVAGDLLGRQQSGQYALVHERAVGSAPVGR
nr:hypothetical protein [Agromyces sp. NDB4Y10]